ncbi:hypothetical protein HZA57_00510, partial [Candidatus Poribacteria bacterium]|nr:hypothetical protein [Candidatus Poribacteria bacterium]
MPAQSLALSCPSAGRLLTNPGEPERWREFLRSATLAVLLLLPAAVASAAEILVMTDQSWPEGTYDYENVTVTNNATLSIAGGSTLNVTNLLRVDSGSSLVPQGKNVNGMVEGQWQGQTVTITAANVTIAAGGSLSANGQGYRSPALVSAGYGPGGGASGGAGTGGGASHGGRGGSAAGAAGAIYGDPLLPVDLGSGGGSGDQGTPSGHGGGAVRMDVAGTFQLDGVVSSNGASGNQDCAAGSGGSIHVTAGSLTGAGWFEARGGDSPASGAGGGGRIGVYFDNDGGFTGFSASTTAGGTGPYPGSVGTVAFVHTGTVNSSLHVYENLVLPEDTELTYDSVVTHGTAAMFVGGGSSFDVGNLEIRGTSVLTLQGENRTAKVGDSWAGEGMSVIADNLLVEGGARLSADGQGYTCPGLVSVGNGPGGGCNGGAGGGSGGGYGGQGGSGDCGGGGGVYGSALLPVDLGSAGGAGDIATPTGHGGGALHIEVANELQLDGFISANGASAGGDGGGGAGGSLLVQTNVLTGGGSFTAKGGNAVSPAGGGGGGRIAIYYEDGAGFTGFTASTANPGTGRSPAAGSVVFVDTSTPNSTLHVYENVSLPEDSALTYDSVILHGAATVFVGGGSSFDVTNLEVLGTSVLTLGGKNRTGQVARAWAGEGVSIETSDLLVEAGARISGDGQGYTSPGLVSVGNGPGGGCNGGAGGGSGGGHGGQGGNGDCGAGGAVYGSVTAPLDLGSGGGCGDIGTPTGHGGGALHIHVGGELTLEGVISANGWSAAGDGGGGAGGSLWIETSTLAGAGHFEANGGSAVHPSGGGGGGRIAVYSHDALGFTGFPATTVTGGTANRPGSEGTAGFFDTSDTPQSLDVWQRMVFGEDSLLNYTRLTMHEDSTFRLGGGSEIHAGLIGLLDTSTMTIEGKNRNAQVGEEWAGAGVFFEADTVQVAAGARITGNGQGYTCPGLNSDGRGPGGGDAGGAGPGGGGAHGGYGGASTFGVIAARNGSPKQPVDLGSSGGSGDQGNAAGHGGGAIHVIAHDLFDLDGTLSVNGNGATEDGGSGAGGSVWIETARFAGDGVIEAKGGDTQLNWGSGSGSGGRVAIYYALNEGFDENNNISVQTGYSWNRPGQEGTVMIVDQSVPGTWVHLPHRYLLEEDEIFQADQVLLDNAALLEMGGGSQLIADGDLLVSEDSTVICRGKNRTGQVVRAWAGAGVTISADTLTIDSTSHVTADGEGYTCPGHGSWGNGPGGGAPGGAGPGGGGGYGGRGGNGDSGAGGVAYGAPLGPLDLGSAGGAGDQGQVVGQGGGAIHLVASSVLTLDGLVTANGASGHEDVGGGAGGSLWIQTATLRGAGSLQANGGGVPGGWPTGSGAGGRIAVQYTDNESFVETTGSSAMTGATARPGEDGTVVFVDTNAPGGHFHFPHRYALLQDEIFSAGSAAIDDAALFIMEGGSRLDVGGDLLIDGNSTVSCLSKNRSGQVEGVWAGAGVQIAAQNLTLGEGSVITGDSKGYTSPGRTSVGNGPGGGCNGGGGGGGGGAHGGNGGPSWCGTSSHHDSPLYPVDPGSAGGAGDQGTASGHGGGAVKLEARSEMTLDGLVTVNGGGGTEDCAGGAGGSILVVTGLLDGIGFLRANGGASTWGGTGGGGGGRIAVHYEHNAGFAEAAGASANAGTPASPGNAGQDGSVVFVDHSVPDLAIHFPQRYFLEPDERFTLRDAVFDDAAVLEMSGGSWLDVLGDLTLADASTVIARGKNRTGQVRAAWAGQGVTISANDMTLDESSLITADGEGYTCPGRVMNGNGPGGGGSGGGGGGGGAGHGGRGGDGAPGFAGVTYDSEWMPVDLGSGGGAGDQGAAAGHGGGAVRLDVGRSLELDGTVSADGRAGNEDSAGGAGGSVFITAPHIDGVGLVRARGGAAEWGSGGGGGGRVAIHSLDNEFSPAHVDVSGGDSGTRDGQAGTVQFSDTPQIVWLSPSDWVLHGTETFQWQVLGAGWEIVTDLTVNRGGLSTVLGDGMGGRGELEWDTTAYG